MTDCVSYLTAILRIGGVRSEVERTTNMNRRFEKWACLYHFCKIKERHLRPGILNNGTIFLHD